MLTANSELIRNLTDALPSLQQLLLQARTGLAQRLRSLTKAANASTAPSAAGASAEIAPDVLTREQHALHGVAWLATYVLSLEQLLGYAQRLQAAGQFGELERLIVQIGAGEYLAQIFGGIAMSQSEVVRLEALGLSDLDIRAARSASVAGLIRNGNTAQARARLAALLPEQRGRACVGASGLDETLESMREQMRRFAQSEVAPFAHQWHLKNEYIPMSVIEKMAALGVFALTVPEAYGGLGLGKESMCVVSEELSRAYIGVGSLGTRSEIAAELVLTNGTTEQKDYWLPKIAGGELIPTAVFTEPNTGSDLASLSTRAELHGDNYRVYGSKTWITHPVRADVMTLLVRTNLKEKGHRGLSMLLATKPRGTDAAPFPAAGMSGSEIEVLGYRGMKEFELAFDGFEVARANLLGGVEGQGFKQLMQTFESARIQTAARAIGVAQAAFDAGLDYAQQRIQFGEPILAFPRVADKLVMTAVEIVIARQMTYFAARQKDQGLRCDLEAGMAKLLAARVAWAAADSTVQIHGGNGFALEYPASRLLCDARILNIFEGAAEIQAQVIGRRLLEA
jgi:(2S)-methylsuccinyl-CoA dehydrogenase